MRNLSFLLCLALLPTALHAQTLKVATFNVSMEATNYKSLGLPPSGEVLPLVLSRGDNQQVKNIAEIIQRVNPDILLLNEFDYIENKAQGVTAFINNYLKVSQGGQAPVDYPYTYVGTVNTGQPSPFDFDNNGKAEGVGADAYAFGLYPGQYAMALLSKYPIDSDNIRTFQHFKWQHMPNAQAPMMPQAEGSEETAEPWFSAKEWEAFRLSSKSHWDVPVNVNGQILHVLAMHPTPPTFDGPENRNGKRNHDEIRLMADYLTPEGGDYIYDDTGKKVSLNKQTRFVLVGDFNAADIGDKYRPGVIEQLTDNPLVNNTVIPVSEGGAASDETPYSDRYTAYWGARADYVLPSVYGFEVKQAGVFWPTQDSPLFRLVEDRKASSDHRMVWVQLALTDDD